MLHWDNKNITNTKKTSLRFRCPHFTIMCCLYFCILLSATVSLFFSSFFVSSFEFLGYEVSGFKKQKIHYDLFFVKSRH